MSQVKIQIGLKLLNLIKKSKNIEFGILLVSTKMNVFLNMSIFSFS